MQAKQQGSQKGEKRLLEKDENAENLEKDSKEAKKQINIISTITPEDKGIYQLFAKWVDVPKRNIKLKSSYSDYETEIHGSVFSHSSASDKTSFDLPLKEKHIRILVEYLYNGTLQFEKGAQKYLNAACGLKLPLLISKLIPLVARANPMSLILIAIEYPNQIILTKENFDTMAVNYDFNQSYNSYASSNPKGILNFISTYSELMSPIIHFALLDAHCYQKPSNLKKYLKEKERYSIDFSELKEIVRDKDEHLNYVEKILDTIDFGKFSKEELRKILIYDQKNKSYPAQVLRKIMQQLYLKYCQTAPEDSQLIFQSV